VLHLDKEKRRFCLKLLSIWHDFSTIIERNAARIRAVKGDLWTDLAGLDWFLLVQDKKSQLVLA
jgi:hypothetical protein